MHPKIAREIELCECLFVTIVIDIVHDRAISVRRKGLIGSTEYFRLISADFTLSYCFSTSASGPGCSEWDPEPSVTSGGKRIGAEVGKRFSNCNRTTTACCLAARRDRPIARCCLYGGFFVQK